MRIIRNILFLPAVMLLLLACDKYPGYTKTESGIYKRLDQFGDCNPTLRDAEFFIMEVSYKNSAKADSGYHFQLHHHAIHDAVSQKDAESEIGLRLMQEMDSMNCGDQISLILPFSEFDNTYLGAFADTPQYSLNDEIELTLHLLRTFDRKGYATYLMQASQQKELSEEEAIELFLMNDGKEYEKHGSCFIQYKQRAHGDTIKAGRDITIRYNTFLLNGERLDDTTEMQFSFGRPGQIVGGLQYGLSFLQKGDEAIIYLPSFLAFGEDGNSSRIVPARTPVFFDLKVLDVKKP